MSDGNAYGWPDRDAEARAANIAAMGHRLAAAGPRTRQRLLDRQAETDVRQDAWAPEDACAPEAWGAGGFDAAGGGEWPAVEGAAPSSLWREWATTIGRVAALGAAAACGFDLVIVALSHGAGEAHRGAGHAARVQAAQVEAVAAPVAAAPVAASVPVVPGEAWPVQTVAGGAITAAPDVLMVAQISAPAPLQVAAPDLALPPAPVAPKVVVAVPEGAPVVTASGVSAAARVAPVRVAPVRVAKIVPPFGHAAARERGAVKTMAWTPFRSGHVVLVAKAGAPWTAPRGGRPATHGTTAGAPVVLARFEPKARSAHAVPAVAFDVPGWLAAEHVAAPRVLVMSEPPHNLVHPAEKAPASVAPAASPVSVASAVPQPAPVRRLPPLVVASSAYGGGAAYGGPAYRPYYGGYYGSPYAAPYGGYYPPPYGAYYGGYGAAGP
jgi:hypothetical protein